MTNDTEIKLLRARETEINELLRHISDKMKQYVLSSADRTLLIYDMAETSLDECIKLEEVNDKQAARIQELEALRSDVLKAIRRQVTTSDKGLIMHLRELDEYAARMTKQANELETTIREKDDEIALLRKGYSTKIKQVAALKEIAVEEVAIRIAYENNMSPVECREYSHCQARRQLAKEHPEVDWK